VLEVETVTQILRAGFTLAAEPRCQIEFPGFDCEGDVVLCLVEPGFVFVTGLQVGRTSLQLLGFDDDLPSGEKLSGARLAQIPLKMPARLGYRARLELRMMAGAAVHGFALLVVHPNDEPAPPVDYALTLTPRGRR
jgi:hypothetical protein